MKSRLISDIIAAVWVTLRGRLCRRIDKADLAEIVNVWTKADAKQWEM